MKYADDTFIFWSHKEAVEVLLEYVNSIRPSIQFPMEEENNCQLASRDVLIIGTNNVFKTSIYHKKISIPITHGKNHK